MGRWTYIITVICLLPGSLPAVAELPDPTRPADYNVAPAVIEVEQLPEALIDWKVSAIRITGQDRSAIVNGKIMRVGDEIGPARILVINPDAVVLDYQQKQVNVRLFGNVVQKKARND